MSLVTVDVSDSFLTRSRCSREEFVQWSSAPVSDCLKSEYSEGQLIDVHWPKWGEENGAPNWMMRNANYYHYYYVRNICYTTALTIIGVQWR